MTERLERLRPPLEDPATQALYEAIAFGRRSDGTQPAPLVAADGSLDGPFGVMLHAPTVGEPLQRLGIALRYDSTLTDTARETAILMTAAASGSAFEWAAHEPLARAAGVGDDVVDAIRTGTLESWPHEEAPGQTAVVEVVRAMLEERSLTDDEVAGWRERLGTETLLELVTLVGYYRLLARMMAVAGI
jgi:4-carboxymuconolactone decarboxylase